MSALKFRRYLPGVLTVITAWCTFVFGIALIGTFGPLTGSDSVFMAGALTVSAIFLAFCVVSLVLIRVLERRDWKGHKGE